MKFLTGDFNGRNVIPLNIYYDGGKYGVWDDDIIDIIYKDLDTGRKYVETIRNPMIEVWIVKPEVRSKFTHIRDFIPKEDCIPIKVHYKSRFKEIGERMGISADAAKASPYVCQADMKIEHFYLSNFILEYHTDAPKAISLSYLDIENDIIQVDGFPSPGEAPINAVTVIDGDRMSAYTFVLGKDNLPDVTGYPEERKAPIEAMRKSFYEQLDYFKTHLKEFGKECHEKFDEFYGVFKYHFSVFDDEVDLMNSLWSLIRTIDTDYTLVWNLPYDAQNLIERPKMFNYNPADFIIDDRFKPRNREVVFVEDTNPLIQKRRHVCNTYTCSTFVDQMEEYVGIRAGRGKLPSAKLNYVAQLELGEQKLDYSEDADIKHLFYNNLWKFVLYNLKDQQIVLVKPRELLGTP